MPRSSTLAGFARTALLALTGCSSAGPEAAETPSSPASEAPDGAGTYSSDQLAGFLETVTDADGAPLRVIPAAQIEQSMEQAQQFLDAVTITPETCAVFVSNSFEVPDGAGYATGVSGVDGDAIQTIVSVSSSSDATFVQDRLAAAEEAVEPCASFAVEAQGVEISQTVEPLEATTGADETNGTVTSQTSSDGAVQQTMTVSGSSGDLLVTAVRTAPDQVPEGTQTQLQDLVDATFAAVD